jgi:hypothetical protein
MEADLVQLESEATRGRAGEDAEVHDASHVNPGIGQVEGVFLPLATRDKRSCLDVSGRGA